jgi:hypothetical protein
MRTILLTLVLVLLAAAPRGAHAPWPGAGSVGAQEPDQEAMPRDSVVNELDAEDEGAPSLPAGATSPLFADTELLEFTLETNIDGLKRDREEENEERPGVLRMTTDDGSELVLDVKVRTRGNFRLKRSTCRFPPIRLNFQKKQVVGTVFEYQDKLKLVTHCQDRGDRWEQNVLKEYSIYRIFNELSDRSFQVRLARITYIDTENPDDDPLVRLAFLIERDDQMAIRLEGSLVELTQMHPARYEAQQAALVSVFQYMVGNTDWSAYQFHNIVPMRAEGPIWFPVPYDFDWSGLVDAPYAEPAEQLSIRNVKERVYRGFCWPETDYAALYQQFEDERADIMAIYDGMPGITEDTQKSVTRYLDEFYDVIGNEGRRRRRIEEACRTW